MYVSLPNHLAVVRNQLAGSANLRLQSVSMVFRSSTPPSSLGETRDRVHAPSNLLRLPGEKCVIQRKAGERVTIALDVS